MMRHGIVQIDNAILQGIRKATLPHTVSGKRHKLKARIPFR
jgi:hypothetical protein